MNEKLILKLLVHWILCQMLSDIAVVCSSGGIFNDLTTDVIRYAKAFDFQKAALMFRMSENATNVSAS
ncbi:CLUMA_CG018997, isoform A [Clunio marinus]|uniref:CLUMA_CG018997, isoform A n=1 Tax=Clunio marinus TaxID=568069 RepID=A0A1J1J2L7_9DIPT|nr:CLUMA_CG018997, isoform A [Clunio marinus]